MIISCLEVKELDSKRDIKIAFASEKYKVEIDISLTQQERQSSQIFNQHLKMEITLGQIKISQHFEKINTHLFYTLLEKKEKLKKYLPEIAKTVLEMFESNSSVNIEDIYTLIAQLLEKYIEGQDTRHVVRDFQNNKMKQNNF